MQCGIGYGKRSIRKPMSKRIDHIFSEGIKIPVSHVNIFQVHSDRAFCKTGASVSFRVQAVIAVFLQGFRMLLVPAEMSGAGVSFIGAGKGGAQFSGRGVLSHKDIRQCGGALFPGKAYE